MAKHTPKHSTHRTKIKVSGESIPHGMVECLLCKKLIEAATSSIVKVFQGWKGREAVTVTHWVVENGNLQQVPFLTQSTYPVFREGFTCVACWQEVYRLSTTRYTNPSKHPWECRECHDSIDSMEPKCTSCNAWRYDFMLASVLHTPLTHDIIKRRPSKLRNLKQFQDPLTKMANAILRGGSSYQGHRVKVED